jgi:hypothetical protein
MNVIARACRFDFYSGSNLLVKDTLNKDHYQLNIRTFKYMSSFVV